MKTDKESKGREQNQAFVQNRERQWQTVGSDGSSDDLSDDSDCHSSSSPKPVSKKMKNVESGDKKRKAHRSHDTSSDDDSSDIAKKEKKDKKHKKEKKDKKHKKHKKDKKKSSRDLPNSNRISSAAINQNEFGKYGIIKEVDFFRKQREFEEYMRDVKSLSEVMMLGKREIMQHFKSYIEDYNTATMPHDKYYDYEAWETHEYIRNKKAAAEQQQRQQQQRGDLLNDWDGGGDALVDLAADEERRRMERKQARLAEESREFMVLKQQMQTNTEKLQSMKRQAELAVEQQVAYKRGDIATVKRVERLIKPDDLVKIKHPWA
jgi:hypothetical protein